MNLKNLSVNQLKQLLANAKREIKKKQTKPIKKIGKLSPFNGKLKLEQDKAIKKLGVLKPAGGKLQFRGKNIKYTNPKDLSNKLNVSEKQAKDYITDYKQDRTIRYLVNNSGDLLKIDLKKKPLALQRFGVKRVNNKKLLNSKATIKDGSIKILDKSSFNVKTNLEIIVDFQFTVSSNTYTYTRTFIVNANPKQINNKFIEDLVEDQYLMDIQEPWILDRINDYKVKSKFTDQEITSKKIKMRLEKPLGINNLYNEVLTDKNWKDCVRDYLKHKYKNISKKVINRLGDSQGVDISEILEFCRRYKIKMVAYNILGDVIESHYPISNCKNKPNLIFISYNNHLYPLKNKILNKVKHNKYNEKIFDYNDGKEILIKLLNEGHLPSNIIQGVNGGIRSFIHEDERYIFNSEYNRCKEILSLFGLADKLNPYISIMSLGSIIEKLYIKESVGSFFPYSSRFVKGGFTYKKETEETELTTIDKNSSYSHSLYCLDKLLKVNTIEAKFKTNINIINKNWLYLVKPYKSSLLLPDTNLYSGEHLLYCKGEGLNFKILEGLRCQEVDNYYKQMIDDLRSKLPKKEFKIIMNVMIGRMESDKQIKENMVVKGIFNNEESKTIDGFKEKLNDDFILLKEISTSNPIFNRKPISIQIKDHSRMVLYEKMKELKLQNEDIIQIKTDSITFKGKVDIELNKNDFFGWKSEEFKPIQNAKTYYNEDDSLILKSGDNNNILGLAYAGCGKTYKIMHDIVKDLDDYIILAPTLKTVSAYQNQGFNAEVIQKFQQYNKMPKESTIIVDEVGMIDKLGHFLLYKCYLNCKRVIAYGDFNQMLPVSCKSPLNGKLYTSLIFDKSDKLTTNYRNNFEISYYDKLINNKANLRKEIKKYQTNWKDAEFIICYRKDTVKLYNMLKSQYLGFKSMSDIGARLILKTNNLRDKNMYNNTIFLVDKVIKDDVYLKIYGLDNSKHYIIKKYELDNFKFAYALTLYGVQGDSIKSFYFPKKDKSFISPRSVYTLISRLKTK